MNGIMRFTREDTVLVVIDVQEKLMPAMDGREKLEERIVKLAEGFGVLGMPKIVTTQYEKGLGKTIGALHEALGEYESYDKATFSAYKDESFRLALEKCGRKTVVIAGVEAHVCVAQTALDLAEAGYKVALVRDCIGSREKDSVETALLQVASAGVTVTCMESLLFELLETSKAPEFKAISAIVK